MGGPGGVLGRLEGVLGRPGGVLGATWDLPGASWGVLGPPGAVLGVIFWYPYPTSFSEPFRKRFSIHFVTILVAKLVAKNN